jgi:hypothetical protein
MSSVSIAVVGIGTGDTAMRPVSRSDGPAISRSGESESDGTAAGNGVGVPLGSVSLVGVSLVGGVAFFSAGCGGAGSDPASP